CGEASRGMTSDAGQLEHGARGVPPFALHGTLCLAALLVLAACGPSQPDRKSTRLNSSHLGISYAVFCLKKKKYQFRTHTLSQFRRLLDSISSLAQCYVHDFQSDIAPPIAPHNILASRLFVLRCRHTS